MRCMSSSKALPTYLKLAKSVGRGERDKKIESGLLERVAQVQHVKTIREVEYSL